MAAVKILFVESAGYRQVTVGPDGVVCRQTEGTRCRTGQEGINESNRVASKLGTPGPSSRTSHSYNAQSAFMRGRGFGRHQVTLRGQKLDRKFSGRFFRPNPAKPFPGKTINVPQQQQVRLDASVEAEASRAQQRQRPVELIVDHALPSPQEQQVKHGLIGENTACHTFADRRVFKAAQELKIVTNNGARLHRTITSYKQLQGHY